MLNEGNLQGSVLYHKIEVDSDLGCVVSLELLLW